MANYGEEQYIHTLEKRLKERIDMVRWLAEYIQKVHQNDSDVLKFLDVNDWMIIAERAVQKNG